MSSPLLPKQKWNTHRKEQQQDSSTIRTPTRKIDKKKKKKETRKTRRVESNMIKSGRTGREGKDMARRLTLMSVFGSFSQKV
jgi:hypothetical protein